VNYREALAWLYATQRFGIKLGLENTERLLVALSVVESRAPRDRSLMSISDGEATASQSSALQLGSESSKVIHVAGTNGKGSVCAMIDAIARTAGHRTGLFTSPHLVSFRERIRVNGEKISEDEVGHGLTEIRERIRDWDPHPTFFEITTALALQHFQTMRCEILVLETGMGGRLDATNAIQSSVSVITPIDFDHEKWLGHSIAEIAKEKAGIIKPRIPVVSAPQRAEAEAIIRRRTEECDAPLQFVNEPWTKTKIALHGEHQKMNAAVAIAALKAVAIPVSHDTIARSLASVEWPGRFQVWDQRIVIDGAHNPAGARILAQTWGEEFGNERATIILAILRDKNAAEIVRAFAPIATNFVLPQIRSERAMPSHELAKVLSSITPSLPYSTTPSVAEAIATAKRTSERILITGSLHFAGEALAFLRGEPNALEECAQ
jgi:dihydrofolate synthase / folylpolyglutamate synthase